MSRGLAALVLALLGCVPRSEPPKSARDSLATARPKVGPAHRVRGLLTADSAATRFRACGETDERWVVDETSGDVAAVVKEMGPEPGHAIFVEVVAADVAKPADPKASRFAKALAIREVRRASLVDESRACDEPWGAYEFRAHGNEPFWAVTISTTEIVFQQPDEPTRIRFPYAPSSLREGKRIFSSATPEHRLEVALEERRCRDGMATALFPLTARVQLDGRTFEGCGQEGAPRE